MNTLEQIFEQWKAKIASPLHFANIGPNLDRFRCWIVGYGERRTHMESGCRKTGKTMCPSKSLSPRSRANRLPDESFDVAKA